MKTNSKIAIAAAATLAASAAFAAIPASAHSSASSSSTTHSARGVHSHATLSATITAIPSSVTSSHQASHGAYFTVYALSASATAVPATEPTSGGHRVGLRAASKGADVALTGSTLTAAIGFPALSSTTTKYALYPSDGSAASLVTVVVDAAGKATVTASRSLTVAYSAAVAAQKPTRPSGEHKGRGHVRGGKHGSKHGGPNA